MTVVLVELSPYDPVAEAVVTVRLTSHDDAQVTSLNGETWWPGIARKPRLTLDFFDGDFSGRITPGFGDMEVDLSAVPDAARYVWADKPAKIWTGQLGQAWEDFTLLFDGLTETATASNGRLRLPLRVNDRWLEQPVLSLEYVGTGGAEGPADIVGNPKPAVFGAPRNVTPTLVDSVNSVYQFHGYGSAHELTGAFDNGTAYPASTGDHASYAALIAASVSAGYVATCLAEGLVRTGAPTFGVFTLDVEGDDDGPDGWVRTPGKVIERIAALAGADPSQIDTASLDALDVAVPRNLSVQVKEQTTARPLIQNIAQSCNAAAGVSWLGQLFVSRVGIGTPALELRTDGSALPPVKSVALLEVAAPFWKMQMAGDRSWRVHEPDEVADVGGTSEVPAAIYQRNYPRPTTPTGDNTPDGWHAAPPRWCTMEPEPDFPVFGPIWMSRATQIAGVTQGTWSEPVMQDSDWQHAVLKSVGNDHFVGTNECKRNSSVVDTTTTPADAFFYFDRPFEGSCEFSFNTPGAPFIGWVGLTTTDPATLTESTANEEAVHNGFYFNAPPGGLWGDAPSSAIVLPWQRMNFSSPTYDIDPNTDRLDDQSATARYTVLRSGPLVHLIIDGVRVRSIYLDPTQRVWCVAALVSPDAHLDEMVPRMGSAERAPAWRPFREIPTTAVDYAIEGRAVATETGIRVSMPSAPTAGELTSRWFTWRSDPLTRSVMVRFKVESATSEFFVRVATWPYGNDLVTLTLEPDGTFNVNPNESGEVPVNGSYVAGAEFHIIVVDGNVRVYQVGNTLGRLLIDFNWTGPEGPMIAFGESSNGETFLDLEVGPAY